MVSGASLRKIFSEKQSESCQRATRKQLDPQSEAVARFISTCPGNRGQPVKEVQDVGEGYPSSAATPPDEQCH